MERASAAAGQVGRRGHAAGAARGADSGRRRGAMVRNLLEAAVNRAAAAGRFARLPWAASVAGLCVSVSCENVRHLQSLVFDQIPSLSVSFVGFCYLSGLFLQPPTLHLRAEQVHSMITVEAVFKCL